MKFPGFFVHPIPLFFVFILALNDHYLKYVWPGWITGKLSDFCGLFFFPLFLCALIYFFARFTWRGLISAILITDLVFAAIKLWSPATEFYLGLMANWGYSARVVKDPWDLIALGVNPLLLWHARRFIEAW